MLKQCRDEYTAKQDSCAVVIFQWRDGGKAGIGNPTMTKKILQFCAEEAQKQIDELEGKQPKEYRVAIIGDSDAAQVYDEEGIEALNEYGEENYINSIRKSFSTEAELNAYLQGAADIGAGDERAPANYAVIMDEDLKKLTI